MDAVLGFVIVILMSVIIIREASNMGIKKKNLKDLNPFAPWNKKK